MSNSFMNEALNEAYEGIKNNHGGPFGCVIVKNGKIIGRGHNRVVINKDPTAHGEVEAIRHACKELNTFDLSGAELYTTAEPCPMCKGAILWANIKKVYYGCNILDSDKIGFRDDKFYKMFANESSDFVMVETNREKCLKLFDDYNNLSEKTKY